MEEKLGSLITDVRASIVASSYINPNWLALVNWYNSACEEYYSSLDIKVKEQYDARMQELRLEVEEYQNGNIVLDAEYFLRKRAGEIIISSAILSLRNLVDARLDENLLQERYAKLDLYPHTIWGFLHKLNVDTSEYMFLLGNLEGMRIIATNVVSDAFLISTIRLTIDEPVMKFGSPILPDPQIAYIYNRLLATSYSNKYGARYAMGLLDSLKDSIDRIRIGPGKKDLVGYLSGIYDFISTEMWLNSAAYVIN